MFSIKLKWLFAHIVIFTHRSVRRHTTFNQYISFASFNLSYTTTIPPWYRLCSVFDVRCSSFFSHHRLKGFYVSIRFGSSEPIPNKWSELTEWQNQPQNMFEDSLVTTVNNRPTTYWTSTAIRKKNRFTPLYICSFFLNFDIHDIEPTHRVFVSMKNRKINFSSIFKCKSVASWSASLFWVNG